MRVEWLMYIVAGMMIAFLGVFMTGIAFVVWKAALAM